MKFGHYNILKKDLLAIKFILITKFCNSFFMFLQYLTIKFRRLFNALVMFHNNFDGIIEPIRLFTLDGHRNKKYV